jgi:hypothetical protein
MLKKGEWRRHLYVDHYPTEADVRQALELLVSANPKWGYAAEVAKELGHELDSRGNYDPSARYEVSDDGGRYGGGASDYTVWK